MGNWLEDEERKKILRQQSDLIESEHCRRREQEVLKRLSRFRELCDRVDRVRPGRLLIDQFNIQGATITRSLSNSFSRPGLHISCRSQDEIFIDVLETQGFNQGKNLDFWGQPNIVIRRVCSLQDLTDWPDDKILNVIQWLIGESALSYQPLPGHAIGDSLPGTQIMTPREEEAEKAGLNRQGMLSIHWPLGPGQKREIWKTVQVVVDGVHGRKTGDVRHGGTAGFSLEAGSHQVSVQCGGSVQSSTIQIVAKQTTQCEIEISRDFWGSAHLQFRNR
jgi:hypothetical protein